MIRNFHPWGVDTIYGLILFWKEMWCPEESSLRSATNKLSKLGRGLSQVDLWPIATSHKLSNDPGVSHLWISFIVQRHCRNEKRGSIDIGSSEENNATDDCKIVYSPLMVVAVKVLSRWVNTLLETFLPLLKTVLYVAFFHRVCTGVPQFSLLSSTVQKWVPFSADLINGNVKQSLVAKLGGCSMTDVCLTCNAL